MILRPQSLPPVSSVIPFTPLIQADHGPHEPAERVIRNEQEYYAFWGGSPPSQPDVDFSKEVVVAVAVGERPTGGYQVAITGITRINIGILGGTYWISYVETPPSGAAPRV